MRRKALYKARCQVLAEQQNEQPPCIAAFFPLILGMLKIVESSVGQKVVIEIATFSWQGEVQNDVDRLALSVKNVSARSISRL